MKKCKFCAEEIQDDAMVCKHCHKDLPKEKKLSTVVDGKQVESFKDMSSKGKIIFLGLLFIIVITWFYLFFISYEPKASKVKSSTKTQSTVVSLGDEAVVNNNDSLNDTSGIVAVAIDKDIYNQLNKASVANDLTGIDQLILLDKVFLIPNGTKVKIIDVGFGIKKVRILEGEYKDRAGWVAYEFVKK